MLRQIEGLAAADDATLWAQRKLAAKNKLSAADAQCVEEAFRGRLASLAIEPATELSTAARRSDQRRRAAGVDKSLLAVPAPRRIRARDHVKSVAKEPCLVCGRRPADTHHLRFAQSPALGRKVSDEFQFLFAASKPNLQNEADRYGAGGAKGEDQGECEPGKHAPDTESRIFTAYDGGVASGGGRILFTLMRPDAHMKGGYDCMCAAARIAAPCSSAS